MTIKKFELEGWDTCYLEGEVTADDIVIGERTTTERLPEENDMGHTHGGYRSTKLVVHLKDEIRELLGVARERTRGGEWKTSFQETLEVYTPCRTESETAIKRMRNKHEKDCENRFNDEHVQRAVERILKNANWEVEDSKRKFISVLSNSMSSVENWDNKPRLDELSTVREEFKKKIKEIEDEMKTLMKDEIDEWLTEAGVDPELKNQILEKSRFKYLPDVLVIR